MPAHARAQASRVTRARRRAASHRAREPRPRDALGVAPRQRVVDERHERVARLERVRRQAAVVGWDRDRAAARRLLRLRHAARRRARPRSGERQRDGEPSDRGAVARQCEPMRGDAACAGTIARAQRDRVGMYARVACPRSHCSAGRRPRRRAHRSSAALIALAALALWSIVPPYLGPLVGLELDVVVDASRSSTTSCPACWPSPAALHRARRYARRGETDSFRAARGARRLRARRAVSDRQPRDARARRRRPAAAGRLGRSCTRRRARCCSALSLWLLLRAAARRTVA